MTRIVWWNVIKMCCYKSVGIFERSDKGKKKNIMRLYQQVNSLQNGTKRWQLNPVAITKYQEVPLQPYGQKVWLDRVIHI